MRGMQRYLCTLIPQEGLDNVRPDARRHPRVVMERASEMSQMTERHERQRETSMEEL